MQLTLSIETKILQYKKKTANGVVLKYKNLENKMITRGQKRQNKSNIFKELGLELVPEN